MNDTTLYYYDYFTKKVCEMIVDGVVKFNSDFLTAHDHNGETIKILCFKDFKTCFDYHKDRMIIL